MIGGEKEFRETKEEIKRERGQKDTKKKGRRVNKGKENMKAEGRKWDRNCRMQSLGAQGCEGVAPLSSVSLCFPIRVSLRSIRYTHSSFRSVIAASTFFKISRSLSLSLFADRHNSLS